MVWAGSAWTGRGCRATRGSMTWWRPSPGFKTMSSASVGIQTRSPSSGSPPAAGAVATSLCLHWQRFRSNECQHFVQNSSHPRVCSAERFCRVEPGQFPTGECFPWMRHWWLGNTVPKDLTVPEKVTLTLLGVCK